MKTKRDELLDGVLRGESHAFARLAEPYRAELERFAVRMVDGDAELGEEVMQETLLNAYRSIRGGARPENLRAWLYAIARNCALNTLRGWRPAMPLPEESHGGCHDAATREVERQEWMDWLMGAIGDLPPRQRDALVASAFEGRSQQEIAGLMGTSGPAVKTLLHRARRTLQAAQPSSLASFPSAALAFTRRAGAHVHSFLAAKLGTKGMAALGWQALVAATVATGVAIAVHSGAGSLSASAMTPSGHAAIAPLATRKGHHDRPRYPRRQREAPTAQVRHEGHRALRECMTGKRLSRGLSRDALRYATRHMPEEARQYTNCAQVLRRAQLRSARSSGRRARAGSKLDR